MNGVRATCVLLLAFANFATAHGLSVAYLDVDGRAVEFDVALRDVALSVPIDANRDERITWSEVEAIAPAWNAWVAARVRVRDDAGPCTPSFDAPGVRRYADGAYLALPMRMHCNGGGPLSIDYDGLFERDPRHRALLTAHTDGRATTALLTRDARHVALDGRERRSAFPTFLHEGVGHILSGYDHLAFLLSLLLPAVLVRGNGRWLPTPDLHRALAEAATIVTAFTVAHSITLSLAALRWVVPASQWVEAAIAASVLLAALNNVWPLVTRRVWAFAFGFGLVHGFGFAGALGETGLPKGDELAALLGFNLGVEAGQLAVVALALPMLFAARLRAWYPRAGMSCASLAIATVAAGWLAQRLGA